MTFLHWKIPGKAGDLIRVRLNTAAYVRILDPLNFEYYRRGSQYQGEGGWSDRLDVDFPIPYKGTFHVVIDLGGQAGDVRATCTVSRR